MLGGSCSPCCSQLCKCGNTLEGYAGQTSASGAPGRWCCNGSRPAEITVALEATSAETSWVSYQNVSGQWFSGFFYDEARGYYRKRYKRTLTLNMQDLNIDYVLQSINLFWPSGQFGHVLCAYGFGQFSCPKVFPGSEPGRTINGITNLTYHETEVFPAYTITFQTCNSNLPGNPPTTGTLRREYEYRPFTYIGFYMLQPSGDWTRDESLDTESSPVACTYQWSFTGRSVFTEPACDLRQRGLSWAGEVTVGPDVWLPNFGNESVRVSTSSEPIGESSMLPQFSLTARIR